MPAYHLIRQRVPFLEQDAVMYPYIEAVRALVASGELVAAVKQALPENNGSGPSTVLRAERKQIAN